jgi:rare lipoprotein A (peptidoglycan hydrolase)
MQPLTSIPTPSYTHIAQPLNITHTPFLSLQAIQPSQSTHFAQPALFAQIQPSLGNLGSALQNVGNLPSLVLSGTASWYGPGFHGRRTASGEIFNQNDLTAAHPNLPFGTMIRVTNRNTGLTVIVEINDRGPYEGDRILDVSSAAANAIGLKASGIAIVDIVILP